MDALQSVLAVTSTILALILSASPYKTLTQIKQKGSTAGFQFAPFFGILLNNLFAGLYGLYILNNTVILVSTISGSTSLYFVYLYYSYSQEEKEKQSIRVQVLCAFVGLFALAYHTFYTAGESARAQAGLVSNAITIYMYFAPLSTMATVIRTKDATSIPTTLSVASLCCSLSWFLYGFTLDDIFVMIPNVFGVFFSSIQLLLVMKYGNSQKQTMPI